ncbi:MerR family transcriptional regulator [Brevibacillus formosus]|uniref:Transcriptional regulator n=2 Tax=Brevibacillus TaxID=55080 RepID=A0A0H0SR77_9BACL|nr:MULTISPECIES: MerR family transcriptional regulator [Brevibacillus]MED1919553.1 MerR family transcriptional regulator [Bacillus thuringiensis]ASJ54242.1 MerR family transcriptional regulator [Brevibacillus formosus]AWX56712.1 MerR family transcriptional regulator [Brevibacillus brevis]EJL29775.1 putative transcriptional regulator [Brevibacillus sp. BC25]KLI00659.1 transcriptional regulator [Brevibacillus formosus]
MSDDLRRNMALFPIGIVMKLTDLTARQIRYYEQNDLIQPARTEGKQRLFSFNDVDRLLEIKALIEKGLNIAGIKQVLQMQEPALEQTEITTTSEEKRKDMSDKELHQLLRQQIMYRDATRHGEGALIRGELSRFFH